MRLLLTLSCLFVSVLSYVFEDYYWRDYKGIVPPDAVQSGGRFRGKEIFIGTGVMQTPKYTSCLLPGMIERGGIYVDFEFESRLLGDSADVKILCAPNPQHFSWQWIYQANEPLTHPRFNGLVIAGHIDGYAMGIGRMVISDGVVVGKVLVEGITLKSFTYATPSPKSTAGMARQNFEVLVYNPTSVISIPPNVPSTYSGKGSLKFPFSFNNDCNAKQLTININPNKY